MARCKVIDTSPRFLAVDLQRQLLPGTFEHALNHLVDHEIDPKGFDARYKNDLTGAAAYPPAMLLDVVLFAYSRGIVSSPPSSEPAASTAKKDDRAIEAAESRESTWSATESEWAANNLFTYSR